MQRAQNFCSSKGKGATVCRGEVERDMKFVLGSVVGEWVFLG